MEEVPFNIIVGIMKKLLILFSLLILLVVSFVGGARFNQHETGQNVIDSGERKILHYVDPMNPANTSKEPGIAPCGMPMEPVYADDDGLHGSGNSLAASLGAVKINLQKQQIIGVQIGEVAKVAESLKITSLGRIAAEENKTYPLVAATDGWVGEVHESTTGSLVSKNQLMGKIRIYDYDFITWQQRYLVEKSNLAMVRRPPLAPMYDGRADQLKKIISAQQQSGSLHPGIGAPVTQSPSTVQGKAVAGAGGSMRRSIVGHRGAETKPWRIIPRGSQSEAVDIPPQPIDKPMQQDQHMAMPMPSSEPNAELTGKDEVGGPPKVSPVGITPELPAMAMGDREAGSVMAGDHSKHLNNMAKEKSQGQLHADEKDKPHPSQVRQELMDLGVGENQLEQLAKSGVYITDVELRSPADGLVLSRNIFPHQRITRGTECFRVADLSRVWVEADIYDLETQYIQPGMPALISMPKSGKQYPATVSEILPRFEAAGRSLKVRLEMDNPETLFRPDMFVDVEFLLNLPETTTVPSAAIIDSGKRQTVYVVVGEGVFEPREVMTGWRFNDRVEIVKGLQPGEKIVVSGNFLIDSESRMKLAAVRLMETTEPQAGLQQEASTKTEAKPRSNNKTIPKGMVKDPICGMNIDPVKAEEAGLAIEADGKTYYFCSAECAEEFHRHGPQIIEESDANPVPGTMSEAGEHNMEQMTMSSGGPQPVPAPTATDPVCGMGVDKSSARSAGLFIEKDDQTYYFCSTECKEQFEQHSEVHVDKAGKTASPEHMEPKP